MISESVLLVCEGIASLGTGRGSEHSQNVSEDSLFGSIKGTWALETRTHDQSDFEGWTSR